MYLPREDNNGTELIYALSPYGIGRRTNPKVIAKHHQLSSEMSKHSTIHHQMADAIFPYFECGWLGVLNPLLRPITVIEVPMDLVLCFDGIYQ